MSVNFFNHLLKSGVSYAFAIHTCLSGNFFNGCPNEDIPLCPSPFVIYSCYCHVLVTLLSSVFCLSQWLDERFQKERSVLRGGDRSNSQVTLCLLEAGVKLEKNMDKILASRSDMWTYWHFLERYASHTGFIDSLWEAIWIRDMDAKLALSFALFKHVSLIFSKIKKNTCLEIILYWAKITSNLFQGEISCSSLLLEKQDNLNTFEC